jgi:YggT family protein
VGLVCLVLEIAFWAVVVWVILSWVAGVGRLPWDHPVRKVYTAIDGALQPVLRPLRSAIPPVRMGVAALDLSPLILIFGLRILSAFIC